MSASFRFAPWFAPRFRLVAWVATLTLALGARADAVDGWRETKIPQDNVRLEFPDEPTKHANGAEFVHYSAQGSAGTSFSYSRWQRRRGESCREAFDRLRGKEIDYLVNEGIRFEFLEASPVRWHGHPAQEWTIRYAAGKDRVKLLRRLDIVCGGRVYSLIHSLEAPRDMTGPDDLRHFRRAETARFLESLAMIEPVKYTEMDDWGTDNVEGRWVAVLEKGTRPAKPIEIAFSEGMFLLSSRGAWGDRKDGLLELGPYKMDTDGPLTKLSIDAPPAVGGPVHAILKFDGRNLTMQFGKEPPAAFERTQEVIFRRPGEAAWAAPAAPGSDQPPVAQADPDSPPANSSTAHSAQSGRGDHKTAPTFPRTDGVYAVESQILVGNAPRLVMDYLVFTDEGIVYSIRGALHPSGSHGLEQPTGDGDGTFFILRSPLKEQPARIQKWLADAKEPRPIGGKYLAREKSVQFTIVNPATRFRAARTDEYQGVLVDGDIRMTENSMARGRAEVQYKFFPYAAPQK